MAVYRVLECTQKWAAARLGTGLFDLAAHGEFQAAPHTVSPGNAVVPAAQEHDDAKIEDCQQRKHISIYRVHIYD
jgi:hypothetical protein